MLVGRGGRPSIPTTFKNTSAVDLYMHEDSCPLFPVKSGVPLIGLGLLLYLAAAFTWFTGAGPETAVPVLLMFIGFGTFLIWLGLFR
ncbi:MAG: hypothetical protein LUQ13_01745 [Methanomicrobiales archaeon]|nr:hypothetical protein [Methanomicrobiales archaeon]